jgi:hypothetical protein
MRHIHGLFLIVLLAVVSCSKDSSELQVPSKYEYTGGRVIDQTVFKVTNNTPLKLDQGIGSFGFTHKVYKDSINAILNIVFKTAPKITAFDIITDSKIKSTSVFQGNADVQESSFTLKDKKVVIDGNEFALRFSEDFSELYLCGAIHAVKGIFSNGTPLFDEEFILCTTNDPLQSAKNIIQTKPASLRYDTIGVSFVDLVYRRK